MNLVGENGAVTFGNGVILSIISILVVFLVLLVISQLIPVTNWFLNRGKKKAAPAPVTKAATPQPVEAAPADDTAAVIAAAVAAYLGSSPDKFVIRSVRRVEDRSWAQTGRTEFLNNR